MAVILNIYKGDSTTLNIVAKNPDGEVIDITGYVLTFTAKVHETDNDNVIQVVVANHTNPTEGQTQIVIDGNASDVAVGKYHYDIRLKDSGNQYSVLVKDFLKIKQPITTI